MHKSAEPLSKDAAQLCARDPSGLTSSRALRFPAKVPYLAIDLSDGRLMARATPAWKRARAPARAKRHWSGISRGRYGRTRAGRSRTGPRLVRQPRSGDYPGPAAVNLRVAPSAAQLPACVPLRPATAHRSDPPMAARRHLRPFCPGAGTRPCRPHPGQPARTAAACARLSTDADQRLAPHQARAHARADMATPARRARRRNLLLHYRPLPPFHHQQPLPPQRRIPGRI